MRQAAATPHLRQEDEAAREFWAGFERNFARHYEARRAQIFLPGGARASAARRPCAEARAPSPRWRRGPAHRHGATRRGPLWHCRALSAPDSCFFVSHKTRQLEKHAQGNIDVFDRPGLFPNMPPPRSVRA